MPKTRRAFTLLEILVIIGIIAVLVGLLVFGAGKMIGGSKAEATKVTLATLQGMLAEFDAKTRLSKPPQHWRWYETGSNAGTITPPASDFDFWRIPYRSSLTARDPDAMDAPGLVAGDDVSQAPARHASRQVLNTQLVMSMLLTLPANRDALNKIAADRQFTPTFASGTLSVAAGNDGVLYTSDDTAGETISYVQGTRVEHQNKRYLCNDMTGPDYATTVAPPSAPWVLDQGTQAPILLDAWNNPIIFVPGTGLRVRLLNGQSSNVLTDRDQTFIIVSPEGKVGRTSPTNGYPYVVQPGRPFWASAGPDGDFAKGDDNIYSFEK